MQAWLARLLNQLIQVLSRLRTRLEPVAVDPDAPPPHWLAHVAERAPHLVAGGRVRSTFASPDLTGAAPLAGDAGPSSYGTVGSGPQRLPPAFGPATDVAGAFHQANPSRTPSTWRRVSLDRLAAADPPLQAPRQTPQPPPAAPPLDIAFPREGHHWPRLDAVMPPVSTARATGALDVVDQPTGGWPDLPPMQQAAVEAGELDPLLESELRRLERGLREMEGLPWIG